MALAAVALPRAFAAPGEHLLQADDAAGSLEAAAELTRALVRAKAGGKRRNDDRFPAVADGAGKEGLERLAVQAQLPDLLAAAEGAADGAGTRRLFGARENQALVKAAGGVGDVTATAARHATGLDASPAGAAVHAQALQVTLGGASEGDEATGGAAAGRGALELGDGPRSAHPKRAA